jgi:hypothetical protein
MQGKTKDPAFGTDGEVIYTIRLPITLREAMQELADANDRNLADEMRRAMKLHLKGNRAKKKASAA